MEITRRGLFQAALSLTVVAGAPLPINAPVWGEFKKKILTYGIDEKGPLRTAFVVWLDKNGVANEYHQVIRGQSQAELHKILAERVLGP